MLVTPGSTPVQHHIKKQRDGPGPNSAGIDKNLANSKSFDLTMGQTPMDPSTAETQVVETQRAPSSLCRSLQHEFDSEASL